MNQVERQLQSAGFAGDRYVLMTAAHDEEALLGQTIESVCCQIIQPRRWVIVDDNSNDRTSDIVESYAREYAFIRLIRTRRSSGRSFSAKGIALQNCAAEFRDAEFDFIGNLDADITIPPHYYAYLLKYFEKHPRLGLVSGFVCEECSGRFVSRPSNRVDSVPHAAQLVRRRCYEEIGGYSVLPYGGEDWHAQTRARMNGWQAESLPQLPIFHHRPTGGGSAALLHRFRLGKLDYSFGSNPVFEVLKCMQRWSESPMFFGCTARLAGFVSSYLRGEKRAVPKEFMAFLRAEQRSKVRFLLRHGRSMNQAGMNASLTLN